jgi:hypothetical protein
VKNQLAKIDIGKELLLQPEKGVESIGTIGDLISALLPNIYILAGIILLLLLIFGGLTVIFSAGKSDPESAAKGQKTISAALIGFLVIFASYWIIQIIEIVTGIEILSGGGL